MSLLPKSYTDFHSKSYWEDFFKIRGGEAFEWYGTFKDIRSLVLSKAKSTDKILIVGCGNSEFSAELYDAGFDQITNLDFSSVVIDDMRAKNTHRPRMRWVIGDMTDMQAIANESFDIVFDKGALDALVSDSSRENLQQAAKMFDEIDRVLVDTGAYMCISLAEEFILKGLIARFAQSKAWEMSVQTIECEKISPFKPFFFNITKIPTTRSCGGLRLWFDSFGAAISSPLIKPSEYAVELVRYHVILKKSLKFTFYIFTDPNYPRVSPKAI